LKKFERSDGSDDESKIKERFYDTLSLAADEYYSKVEKSDPEQEKLIKRLEKQVERKAEIGKEATEYRNQADFIYANQTEIEEIIRLAKAGKFDKLEEKYGKLKKDLKEKSIEFEVNQ